jgi:hypothetical protein
VEKGRRGAPALSEGKYGTSQQGPAGAFGRNRPVLKGF